MEIEVTTTIGRSTYQIVVDESDPKEALLRAAFYGSAPRTCGECESTDVTLNGRRAGEGGEYTFIEVLCLDCGAKAPLGEYKKGGFYWKPWEVYEPNQ